MANLNDSTTNLKDADHLGKGRRTPSPPLEKQGKGKEKGGPFDNVGFDYAGMGGVDPVHGRSFMPDETSISWDLSRPTSSGSMQDDGDAERPDVMEGGDDTNANSSAGGNPCWDFFKASIRGVLTLVFY